MKLPFHLYSTVGFVLPCLWGFEVFHFQVSFLCFLCVCFSVIQIMCFSCDLYNNKDGTGREVGGGFRIGNTCMPVVDSC